MPEDTDKGHNFPMSSCAPNPGRRLSDVADAILFPTINCVAGVAVRATLLITETITAAFGRLIKSVKSYRFLKSATHFLSTQERVGARHIARRQKSAAHRARALRLGASSHVSLGQTECSRGPWIYSKGGR